MCFCFSSRKVPRWLFGKGHEDQALKIFTKVAGPEHAAEELRSIRQNAAEHVAGVGASALFSRKMRFVMLIALTIAFFQQITGINAIFYYLPTIFSQAGGGTNAAFKQAVIVGLVNLGMTFVAIKWIDRLGRKPLLVIGATGMAISLLTCSWAFHNSNYQLTEKSFAVLSANKVPADLIGDLQKLEPKVFATDKEFMADLDSQLGADRLAPFHDSLTTAGLNIRCVGGVVCHHWVRGVLCHFAGAGDVGVVVGNFSECVSRRGDFRGRLLELGRERLGHVYFSVGVVALRRGGHFSRLWTHGAGGVAVRVDWPFPKPRANRWKNWNTFSCARKVCPEK